MSLPHAILGLLEQEPMTGYDLKTKGFDNRVNHFWSADQAQIYRTLDKLVEQGLVDCQLEIQQDRPNRKVYSLTEAGRDELRQWQTLSQPLTTIREPFLIQLFFGENLSNESLASLLEQQLVAHRERLAQLQQVDCPALDAPTISRRQVLRRLTLEAGLQKEQALIQWLETAIETVKNLPE